MEIEAQLDLLGDAAQFDVSNPGATFSAAVRQAEADLQRISHGIFMAQAGGGRCLPVFKVLLSNECRNDCAYCSCRRSANCERSSFTPVGLASTFMQLERRGLVQGLFLSSGIRDNAERTQERMIDALTILRKQHHYSGFVHLKLLPGVSDGAVAAAARVADRLSLNLEAPTVQHLATIAPDKQLRGGLLRPLRQAAQIERSGLIRSGLTTQFVVGGAGDTDTEILGASDWLYRKLSLRRAYYSAFHPVSGSPLEGSRQLAFAGW
jgi:predicted DNA-binding helix-hairpin-helix protein